MMSDTMGVRKALILGAAGTLGCAITRILLARHYECFLIDREESAIRQVAHRHAPALPYAVADVTSQRELAAAIVESVTTLGRLDAVVFAFGIEGPVCLIEDVDETAFDETMAINTKGIFLALKICIPILKSQCSGSVVALGSISSTMAAPMLAAYAASKHALLGLVRTAARETAEFGVRINAVCPGPVESNMMTRIENGVGAGISEQNRPNRDPTASIPMRRYATADEIASTVAFLCSDESRYTTGQTFLVDGGYTGR